ncbi:glycerophosphodiester phosphodiesterase family protein [Streptomyces sp. TS71-3]|uniref:glycerophosphodiester phosphodiesterase family protein n=1 Tax=Streptomyces sp. TS71-3 TaxID=2733862 RepID=UPI001B0CA815|nr:glycerophosphodiester phosphodiesterase family protein [Streptomyces sp. TS71-3]GHJ40168.1 glycerophosphoryl diester phosphodiesterase [Streptomyces sp. TS71-3]
MTDARQHAIQVVAHRGASEDAPEHTLAAYRKAIEDGADALECDVRLTADGHLVCVHDRRVNRTSNGRGAVSALELSELAALDFGSWKRRAPGAEAPGWEESPDWDASNGPAGAAFRPEDTSVLTLERLLSLVVGADRRIGLAIETKHPTRWAGQVEERLLATLRRFGLDAGGSALNAGGTALNAGGGALDTGTSALDVRGSAPDAGGGVPDADVGAPDAGGGAIPGAPVRVMSFSSRSLQRVHNGAPGLPTVFLMQFLSPRHREGRLPAGVGIAGPSMRIVRNHPGFVARLKEAGRQVHVWTVDEPEDVDLCVALGVDAIITNRPKQVLRRLGRA